MSEVTTTRPAAVTTVMWLVILSAIIDIVSGASMFIIAGDPIAVDQAGKTSTDFMLAGYVLIGLGAITAIIASLISKGSQMARLFISVLMVLRVGGHIWALVVGGTATLAGSVIGIAVAIMVLALLWGAEANAFFDAKQKAKEA